MATRVVDAGLRSVIRRLMGYDECTDGPSERAELPGARIVVILQTAAPLMVDGRPGPRAFVAGLGPGATLTRHQGHQQGVQLDLRPAHARRIFDVALSELAGAVVPLEELLRPDEAVLTMPDGKVGHAELKLPDLWLYLSDEFPDMGVQSPSTLGGTAVSLALYVDDVDAVVATAVKAGATQEREIKDEFFGDRVGLIVDPFGHRWFVQTQIEEVGTEEMERRFAEMMQGS